MSFPDYLRERLSEDYKNLIIQKLEEVKKHSEELKERVPSSVSETGRSLQERLQRELDRIQETIQAEISLAQEKMASDVNALMDESSTSWYHSDLTPYDQQLDILVSDIVSNIPVPPKKEHAGLVSLVDLMKKLDTGNTQSDILNIVLQHISEWVDRAVLFVVKGEQAAAWAAFGLGADWDAARIRQVKADLAQDNVLRKAVSTGEAAYGVGDEYSENATLFSLLGSAMPAAALAFPIFVRGKIAGILYADVNESLAEQPDLPNLLHLAARSAGFAVDLLPMRPKVAAATAAAAAPRSAMAAAPAAVTVAAAPVMAGAPVPAEDVAPTVMMNLKSMTAPPAVEEAEGTVIMHASMLKEAPAVAEEDQKLHDDAKRFARLLVSEIKLYNEAQVSAGRERKDLYERLKDDIERSRRMYMDRVPQHIHTTTNYFYEELVRTLANGDPSLLGM